MFAVAYILIMTVLLGHCLARVHRQHRKVNWPHVYELEHEIWPEIKHEQFNCKTCFPVKYMTSPLGPIKVKMPPDYDWLSNRPPVDPIKPDPPRYVPVRTSNEPLVAETLSGDAMVVQNLAFETVRVRYQGEVASLRQLMLELCHDLRVGDCIWVKSVGKYFVWHGYGGWIAVSPESAPDTSWVSTVEIKKFETTGFGCLEMP